MARLREDTTGLREETTRWGEEMTRIGEEMTRRVTRLLEKVTKLRLDDTKDAETSATRVHTESRGRCCPQLNASGRGRCPKLGSARTSLISSLSSTMPLEHVH